MDDCVMLNGEVRARGDARVSPLGDGFMSGLGLFETVNVRDGRPAFFRAHYERLAAGALELGIEQTTTREELGSRCVACLEMNRVGTGVLKIVVFQDIDRVSELILTSPHPYPPETWTRGFRLRSIPIDAPGGLQVRVKTLNRLAYVLARRSARAAGADEALLVAHDASLREGSATNVFVVKDGIVLTPPLNSGILPGVARSQVLGLTGGIKLREQVVMLDELDEAAEVFVTNSLAGIMPVSWVDGRSYDLKANPVTRAVAEQFLSRERASLESGE